MRRALIYAIMAGRAVVATGNGGQPTFQMFISFALCAHFLKDKRGEEPSSVDASSTHLSRSRWALSSAACSRCTSRSSRRRGFELIPSLFTMVSLFIFATFLK